MFLNIKCNQWFNDIKQCVFQGRRGKRYETMTVEPMAKDINLDLLKQVDKERMNLNQNLFFSQEVNQQKHYSIVQQDNQQIFFQTEKQNLNSYDNDRITILQQSLGESALLSSHQQNPIDAQVDQPEISVLFEDLKYKLSYDYLLDESDFNLYLFEDCIRIMQNRNDSYNFRIFLPIIDATPCNLIMALFDVKTQTKWNKQIKNIQQLENLGLTIVKIKETRVPYGYLYQPRTFTYVRQFYSNYNEIYVIDKSDDKGTSNINWNICAVFFAQNTINLYLKCILALNFKKFQINIQIDIKLLQNILYSQTIRCRYKNNQWRIYYITLRHIINNLVFKRICPFNLICYGIKIVKINTSIYFRFNKYL